MFIGRELSAGVSRHTFSTCKAGLRSRRKNDTAPAPELFLFMNMVPAPAAELLVSGIQPGRSLFYNMSLAFVRFCTFIFLIVLMCFTLIGKQKMFSTQN